MTFLYDLLVVLHLIGMAAIVGGWLTVLRSPRIVVGMVHGALLQLVTGLLLVGLACLAMGPDGTLAMLLFLYLIGLAIVLRAVMAPAARQ